MFLPACETVKMHNKQEWDEFRDSCLQRIRRTVEEALIRPPFPCPIHAYCGCCEGQHTMEISGRHARIFSATGEIKFAYSEAALCPQCQINSRMRYAVEQLRRYLAANPAGKVYLTEKRTALFAALQASGVDCQGSEWLGPDKVPGTEYDGTQHQDIQHLTFESETFDVVMSLDVLEHVDDPVTAACEMFRVLKPGGSGILTFPFYPNQRSTIIRSRIKRDGAIENVRPARFHGNPLGGGSLVFRELSWDYISTLHERLGDAVKFVNYWSLYRAHFGAERFALLLNKRVAS